MELDELLKLIQAVSDSELTGFKYETDSVSLNLKKEKEIVTTAQTLPAAQTLPTVNVGQPVMPTQPTASMVSAVSGEKTAETKEAKQEGFLVKSPLVGTFYAAPAEDAAPYVAVGDTVKKGQIVAIVEAMKLMNDIECDFDGTVTEILVENGEMVEYGQPLFRIA